MRLLRETSTRPTTVATIIEITASCLLNRWSGTKATVARGNATTARISARISIEDSKFYFAIAFVTNANCETSMRFP